MPSTLVVLTTTLPLFSKTQPTLQRDEDDMARIRTCSERRGSMRLIAFVGDVLLLSFPLLNGQAYTEDGQGDLDDE